VTAPRLPALLLALHYQNEVVHPAGKIRLGLAEGTPEREAVIAAAKRLLDGARAARVPVVSVRIAFSPGHAEIIENAEIWRGSFRRAPWWKGAGAPNSLRGWDRSPARAW
jgi:nicotinamidase-related amidase